MKAKTILTVIFMIATNVVAQTTPQKPEITKEAFIQHIDSMISCTKLLSNLSQQMLKMEADTLSDFFLETVGKDNFWNQVQTPVTQEKIKEILNNYIQSFDEVSVLEHDAKEEKQRVIPMYKDNYKALTQMIIYCGLKDEDIYLHNADSSIIISYIDPKEVDKIILDAARPSAMLDSIRFTIEEVNHDRLRLIMENSLQNGQGISRKRFIEAVAVYADGHRSSFPTAEIRQSQVKKMSEYVDDILTKLQCTRKKIATADQQQLEEIRNEVGNNFLQTLPDNLNSYGTKNDKITRLFNGKIKQVEIYYRTDPIGRKTIVRKELF